MSERKNVDKLFQEKFKDFEAAAPETAWPEIERRLKKKKDRRVLPIWWRWGGVAAVLALALLIGNGLGWYGTGSGDPNSVVLQERSDGNSNAIQNSSRPDAADSGQENRVSPHRTDSNNGIAERENAAPSAAGTKNGKMNTPITNANEPAGLETSGVRPSTQSAVAQSDLKVENEGKTLSGQASRSIGSFNKQKNDPPRVRPNAVAVSDNETKPSKTQNGQPVMPRDPNKPVAARENNNSLADNTEIKTELKQPDQNPHDGVLKALEIAPQNKIGSVSENPGQQKKLDSTAVAAVAPNALEELLHEKENKVPKEPKLNRWQVSSNIAPIYFGSTSGGSPIDSAFAGKSKDYNTQLSYGIGVNYAVNKKLKIRVGVNKVNLNYDTNDVQLYATLDNGGIGTLDMPAQTAHLNLSRNGNTGSQTKNGTNARTQLVADAGNLSTDVFEGYINQRMGYVEVPVELSYAVLNKRLGVNVIAGLSTLFLNENKVLLSANGYTTDLGKANNLNRTHFSSNIGLGLKYGFWKAFEANLEPIFKYQINTFSRDSGNFKPYFFGLYTGVSFRF